MSSFPKVSVLLPAYNHGLYINAAIQSVLDQTYPNIELLIADDNSTDSTWECISNFKDARIQSYRHHQNLGAHQTINELIGRADGDIIAIINSDDVFHKERLTKLVAHLAKTQSWLVASEITLIDSSGTVITDNQHWWQQWYQGLLENYYRNRDIKQALLAGNFFITTSNFVFTKQALAAVGCFEDYRYVHDYSFLLKLMAASKNETIISFFDEKLLSYRLHDSNTIRENPLAANEETFALLELALSELILTQAQATSLAKHFSIIKRHIENIYLAQIEQRQQELTVLKQKLDEKSAFLDAVLNSKSYKIATHIRNIAIKVKAVLRKDHDGLAPENKVEL